MDVDAVRGAGFSGSKILALRDLAAKTEGIVPTGRAIKALDDEAIVERWASVAVRASVAGRSRCC
ncbi:MAG: hypothetical protein U0231_06545 [Nitrospiraceae bacterium]